MRKMRTMGKIRKMRKGYGRRAAGLLMAAAMSVCAVGCGNGESGGQNGNGTQEDLSAGEMSGGDSGGAGGGESASGQGTSGEDSGSGAADKSGMGGADKDSAADAGVLLTDFGLRLLRNGMEEADAARSGNPTFPPYASMPYDVYRKPEDPGRGNILISPLSVVSALAMTGGGARGETLLQMEETFGISVPELSVYLSDYQRALPAADKYRLSMANGIWFTADERFTVEEDFLEKNGDLFDCTVRRTVFDDSALQEINGWVKDNTDGMIEEILDEIPPDAVMYLVNALAFEAEWERIYHDYEVRTGEFTKEDGTALQAELMYSEEEQYLEDAHAAGFLKYYADRKYAFAALLPQEGMSLAEYMASLDGEKLRDILENPMQVQVNAAIPKYRSMYGAELSDILRGMGMADAFDIDKADFSGLGHSSAGNVHISRVLHKTFIAVDAKGTRAGAVTAVEATDRCAAPDMSDTRTVYLNRPFLYMIIDCERNLPIFMGVVTGV